MADSSSLYGSTTPSGTVSSSNYTTLYSGGNNFVPSGDNVIISGTLTVNGCAILTDCNTFNLLPFNATTVDAFGSATAVSIGGATGVTTIQNQLATGHYLFPLNDGTANQVLTTNGSGVLSWITPQNTTYTINASATTAGANFNLVGSDFTTDTIKFAEGSGVSVVRTDANTITITNTDPGSAGVTSIIGTANQVIASSPTGAVTLSLPQSIATTSTPTFAGVNAGNITVGVATDNSIATTTGDLVLQPTTGQLNINAIVNITGDYLNLNSDDTANNAAMRFGNSSELLYNRTADQFEVNKDLYTVNDFITKGSIVIEGTSTGYSNFAAPATGSNLNYVLPGAAGAANTVLTNDGSGNLSWALPGGGGSTFGNISIGVVTDNTIGSTNTNGDIILQPNGNGDVNIAADTLFIGDGGSNAFITTNGVGTLYINTNNGTNTGSMFIESGINGNIILEPNAGGTGQVKTYNDFIVEDGVFFVSKANQRVGINNTNPQYELHIDRGADGYTQLGMTTSERTTILTMNDGDDLLSLSYGALAGTNRLQFSPTDQWFNTGKLGIGTVTPAEALDVVGNGKFSGNIAAGTDVVLNRNLVINGQGGFESITLGNTQTTSSTSQVPLTGCTEAGPLMKIIMSIKDEVTGEIHGVELLAIQNATTVKLTTYAELYTSSALATFAVDQSAGIMRLLVTPASTNLTSFSYLRTAVE